MAQKKFQQAETAYRTRVRLDPGNAYSIVSLAIVLAKQNKLGEADAEMKALLQRKPDAYSYDAFAYFLSTQNRFAEAEAAQREALRLEQTYDRYAKLGKYLEKQRKHGEAEAAFREALRRQPELYTANQPFAEFLKGQERWAEAEKHYRVGLVNSGYDFARIDLGFVLAKQNKTAESNVEYKLAEGYYRKQLVPRPLNSHYRHRLGLALESQNKLVEAEKEFAEAVRLDPDTTEYKESLDRVRAKTKAP